MQLEVVVLPTWTRVQGLVPKGPDAVVAKVTWPLGKLAVPMSVSLTVAVQLLGLFTGTLVGAQTTAVEVVRGVTVWAKLPVPELELEACFGSMRELR